MDSTSESELRDMRGAVNPYQPPGSGELQVVPYDRGTEPRVRLIHQRLLYRSLHFEAPLQGTLTYNAMQLSDELRWDGHVICRRYPWLWLYERLSASLPTESGDVEIEVRIRFRSFARIREFVVSVEGQEVYREQN